MKRKHLIILICATLFILFSTIFFNFYLVEVDQVGIDLQVGSTIGFDAGTDAIHFGRITPGNSGLRSINITQNNDFPVKISIGIQGDIAPYVQVSTNNFWLDPKSIQNVTFRVNVPAEFGNYSGVVKVYYKRF